MTWCFNPPQPQQAARQRTCFLRNGAADSGRNIDDNGQVSLRSPHGTFLLDTLVQCQPGMGRGITFIAKTKGLSRSCSTILHDKVDDLVAKEERGTDWVGLFTRRRPAR